MKKKPNQTNLHSPNVISEALAAAHAKGHTRLIALKVRVNGVRCIIGLN